MIPLTERQIQVLSWLKTSPREVADASPGDIEIVNQLVRLGLVAEHRGNKQIDHVSGELLGWYALPNRDWNP